ncbi:MAG: ribonuclease H-like domain-containing protein [Thermoplasmata archaeon]
MLRSTFLHLEGIGRTTEANLWRAGILDWAELEGAPGLTARSHRIREEVRQSEAALRDGDPGWFARRLPPSEHWRLYPAFSKAIAYLDIETTSLSPYEGVVTVVTVHGSLGTRSFVRGDDLDELPAHLGRYGIVVTFNGSLFDIPFLEVHYPTFIPPPGHIDLRFLFYRIGQAGGLKRIEERLGIGSRAGVEGVRGLDAVRLWNEFMRGNSASLERLVRYNRADTVNLEPLLSYAAKEMRARLLPPSPSTPPRPLPHRVR